MLLQSMEECNEIQLAAGDLAQRLSKALRFGLDQTQSEQILTNRERILMEFTDLVAVMELAGFTLSMIFDEQIKAKHAKVEKYLDKARAEGTLDETR